MKQFKHNNIRLTTSRHRGDSIECVNDLGEIVLVPEQDTRNAPEHEQDILPGMTRFPLRDPSFVVELQNRRLRSLAESRTRRRKTQSTRQPSEKVKRGIASALDGLSPELQALALQKLTKKR